jgi:hypothetical protein
MMNTYFSFLIPALLTLTFSLSAQHKHHSNCPSCQRMKKETLAAYNQWGGLKALNIDYNLRSDTFDVYNYDVDFKINNISTGDVTAACGILFTPKLANQSHITLDLLRLTVDSIQYLNSNLSYSHNDTLLFVNFPSTLNVGDSVYVKIFYHGRPQSDATWGGFYFQNGYGFNLGVGFSANPHTFGRVWHPCFDNFVERATYNFKVFAPGNKAAHCNGILTSDSTFSGQRQRTWVMSTPIPTYLACIAVNDYATVRQQTNGILGTIPIELVALPADTTKMKNSFANLNNAIAAYEYWFGPYRWNKVGYSAVPFNNGAMEHATNIAYPVVTLNGNLTYETLMAHELSHHWWGDLVTCKTAEDMWINEGMASYCEHLFVGYVYGWDRYISDVKTNHYDVLENAHLAEGGYRPISGVPHEFTYGDHVYNKGASVAHNLRWYLGDSLFRAGMSEILDSFGLNNINSQEMRDFLSRRTGVNLNDFFNDWVFNGGFSHFEVDSFKITQNGSVWNSTVRVRQRLLGANNFHNNTPIQFTFFDNQWNKVKITRTVSGEYTLLNFQLPFAATSVILNEEHRLNQARMDDQAMVRNTGFAALSDVRLVNFNITVLPDSAWIHAEYHPLAPDPIVNNPNNYRISQRRYWSVNGIWSNGFDAEFRIEPNNTLDADLLTIGADSLMVLYRESAEFDWREHPDYTKVSIAGFNFLRVNTILKGDYALGNGQRGLGVMENETNPLMDAKIFPNPASSNCNLEFYLNTDKTLVLELSDLSGRVISSRAVKGLQGKNNELINISNLETGIYFVNVKSNSENLTTQRLVISK